MIFFLYFKQYLARNKGFEYSISNIFKKKGKLSAKTIRTVPHTKTARLKYQNNLTTKDKKEQVENEIR